MMINLIHMNSWVLIAGVVVVAILVLRFFSHLLHFVVRFFWHGCATAVVLVAAYVLLHSFLHLL